MSAIKFRAKLLNNQDLFRASAKSLDPGAIAQALLWWRGEASYPYPTSIHLDLTLRCTARCIQCQQWTWPKHNEFSIEQLERLFSIFKTWGVRTVTLGGGNPLLHAHICSALQIAHKNKIDIGIISEGIDLSEELADAICQNANWIRFSLDGPKADIHEKIRNKPGLYDLVIQDINILKLRRSSLKIGLNCVVQKSNYHCLSGMIDLGLKLNLDTVLFKIPHGDDSSGRYLLSAEEWKIFVEWVDLAKNTDTERLETNLSQISILLGTVFQKEDALIGKPVKNFYKDQLTQCFAPFFFLTCDSEGNMFPCDYLQADTRKWKGKYNLMRNEFCLGNVLQDSQNVIKNLDRIMRDRVGHLPANGYEECGCCTRFCQLNAVLTQLSQQLQDSAVTEQNIIAALGCESEEESKFL